MHTLQITNVYLPPPNDEKVVNHSSVFRLVDDCHSAEEQASNNEIFFQ